MEIGSGRFCALLGPNGSGKTTLMRCINSILKPEQGKVQLMNKDVAALNRPQIAKLVSFVPQSSHTVFAYSCLEMVLMGGVSRLKMWKVPGPQEQQKARQVCDEIGIGAWADGHFNQLSGGQQQMVMLARALYQETPIMLLDEPSSHLDFANQHKVMGLIRKAVKVRGVTALITLHDPNLALHYCDEVIVLKQGRIIANGLSEEILNDNVMQVTFGDNIQVDDTSRGKRVIVPKYGPEGK
jgi:iron complex transport system ATP-binding protein